MNNNAGWCGSGGSWVTPELSMQRLVWTETRVDGPKTYDDVLPKPNPVRDFYRDVRVLAFPTPVGEDVAVSELKPQFSLNTGAPLDLNLLQDGDTNTGVALLHPELAEPPIITLEFSQPLTMRQLQLAARLTGDQLYYGSVHFSTNGVDYIRVREFVFGEDGLRASLPDVHSRWFRVVIERADPTLKELFLTELQFSPAFRLEDVEGKSASVRRFYPTSSTYPGQASYPQLPASVVVAADRVQDLTTHLDTNGNLTWQVPDGKWTILRLGHTSTGKDNHPAPESGRGLEPDKLSKIAAETTFNAFIGTLVRDNADARGTFTSTHIDSWEVGSQNWTTGFREEFAKRRGYDLIKYLPAVTGRAVDSLETSERFLWDLRRTVSEMMLQNYASHMRTLANASGLQLSIEAYGAPADDVAYGTTADEPMGEFWSWSPYGMAYSCTEMASAAHIEGRPIVAAEAFTATDAERWLAHPYAIKVYGDWAFCEGINRMVVHRFALQPWTDPPRAPGMSMGPWGLHYERTQTWWDDSRPWHIYLARCQHLLRQGRFVADICYLSPEETPMWWRSPIRSLERPGYNFDVCSPAQLARAFAGPEGTLTFPSGMSYRLLVLPNTETMTPELLRTIHKLALAGVTVVGQPPAKSPSLANYPECDAEVSRLAAELWGFDKTNSTPGTRTLGRGRVFWGVEPAEVLAKDSLPPDFTGVGKWSGKSLRYLHRRTANFDIYFVANPSLQAEEAVCEFRVHQRIPEFWWPETGRVERAAIYGSTNGTTRVPIRLSPAGSVFVVFEDEPQPSADPIVEVRRDGEVLVDTGSVLEQTQLPEPGPAVTNDFAFSVWVKPEPPIELPVEEDFGRSAFGVQRNDAVYPAAGHEVFGGPKHAAAGLSVGVNGVCVIEHSADYFAPILVHPCAVTNWTHLTVVYQGGIPRLYVGGDLAREGMRSRFIVHPSVGVRHRRGVAPFKGSLGEIRLLLRSIGPAGVLEMMRSMPTPATPSVYAELELLDADAGKLTALATQPGRYTVRTLAGRELSASVAKVAAPHVLEGSWQVAFSPEAGIADPVIFDRLLPWNEHTNTAIQHFSGTAKYLKRFELPLGWIEPSTRLLLDLGKLEITARVFLNGKDLGTVWKAPFSVDITDALKPGENQLEIRVTNLWINRLIGDEHLPEDSDRKPNRTLKSWPDWLEAGLSSPAGRRTFTTWRLYTSASPLQPSGLIGPVVVIS
jgi:hypothetical protein